MNGPPQRGGLAPPGYLAGSAVDVDSLRVRRGDRLVIDGIDLEIGRGAITGLLGPSGCGKSTLLRAIVGVQLTHGGRIRVLGRPAGSPDLRRAVGYMTQAPSVYGDLTVAQNLRYFGEVIGARADDVRAAARTVGLGDALDARVDRLSGGQRSRVSLAVALLGSPQLLVLDEPTVGLDPVLRESLWEVFRDLADSGATLLVSSHVMDEAERCDSLVLMRDGGILAQDSPAGLRQRTGAEDVETAFLRLVRDRAVAA